MDKRKNALGSFKICRFCLSQDHALSSLHDRIRKPKNDIPLPLKILSCLSVEVFPSDKMPPYICQRCHFFMEIFHEYKEVCRRADERILEYIQKGTVLESLGWPSSLTKVHRIVLKSKPNVIRTVIEGGTTVQVTSQDGSDSEVDEDEENVFNIKIADGSQEGPKCIKVVTSKNEEKEKGKQAKEVMSCADSDEDEEPINFHGAKVKKCWPCDQCDCTYPLRQLLQLHMRQKHRVRKVSCDQCNACFVCDFSKFFTKFDLMVHQVRHSDEMPFQCVACDRKFKRLVLLKRHEKLMHSDIPQLACPNCPATFLSLEELQAHQRRHVRHVERNHACESCGKRFLHKTTLRKHMDVVHPVKPDFVCEYCPAQFSSVTKLARHLRTHADGRLFPCKYCDKSFLRSHHYTRHLRLNHRNLVRNARGSGPTDVYRCEQCEECFESQDELIYHSAIHATQNLTCPLCQEKFEDVDAVTAHIKSHVNGTEFMCDLCELVFTSQNKLDIHLTTAHAEELDNDESMEDMDAEEEDEDDNGIHVKEEEDHMVVEIKKTDGFMLPTAEVEEGLSEEKPDNTNSEESEAEASYTELATVDTVTSSRKETALKPVETEKPTSPTPVTVAATITKIVPKPAESVETSQTASILRKAEEVKRKVQQISHDPTEKKEKTSKVEGAEVKGASDKSLRLLEKELQELKRTNTRNEVPKTPVRTLESLRNRRPQLHTSTPKTKAEIEKKSVTFTKSPAIEKKIVERPERKILTKENKEPKEAKDTKTNSAPVKEEKREEKEKKEDVKEKETPKNVVKNGTAEKNTSDDNVRRSTRPSKIKDYAKMIRDKAQDSSDDSDDADDEYKEIEKVEIKKTRRGSIKTAASKQTPQAAANKQVATPPAAKQLPSPSNPRLTHQPGTNILIRKRGRPRKEHKEIPSKLKKEEPEDDEKESEVEKPESDEAEAPVEPPVVKEPEPISAPAGDDASQSTSSEQKTPSSSGVLMSPTGQTLKKVPIKALPPGIKPFALPVRPTMGPGELCEMQIGKKVVKVQKIVMTKAEVEAMAKKGLVEMKDGTMVLKQGIKIPTSDALSLKSTLVGDKEAGKESPIKTDKPSLAQSNSTE